MAVQLIPISEDENTPQSAVPAKIVVPLTTKDKTPVTGKPLRTESQLAPLLEDKKIPLPAPAKIVVPIVANELTEVFDKPLLTAVQLPPLSVLRNRPSPSAP